MAIRHLFADQVTNAIQFTVELACMRTSKFEGVKSIPFEPLTLEYMAT